MKKVLALICFVVSIQVAFTQSKYADSLKAVLSATSNPIEQFDLLNKINEAFFENGDADLESLSSSALLRC